MKNQFKSKMMLLGAAFSMLIFAANVNAQRPGFRGPCGMQNPPMGPDSTMVDRMVDRMAEDLALTDSQKEKIREIHYAHITEAKAQQKQFRAEAEKHREEMDKSRDEMDGAVMKILNADQKEKFENERPGRGPGYFCPNCPCTQNRQGRGPGKRGYYCPNR